MVLKMNFTPLHRMEDDGTVVEYFGLMGNKNYEYRVNEKLKIFKKNKIKYIAIYPNDINRLDFLFKDYLATEEVC